VRNKISPFQLSLKPAGSNSQLPSARDTRKLLGRYSLLLAPGLLGSLLALILYPPLDAGPFVAFGLCAFSVPLLLPVFKRTREDVGGLRTVYLYSSLALVLLALLLFLNGRLDRSPRSVVKATVIQKRIGGMKSGTEHWLTVSSWRPGRSLEKFLVSSREFNRAVVGRTVRVEVHQGFFGLPWSGNISPE